jgi:hypothetical protein
VVLTVSEMISKVFGLAEKSFRVVRLIFFALMCLETILNIAVPFPLVLFRDWSFVGYSRFNLITGGKQVLDKHIVI